MLTDDLVDWLPEALLVDQTIRSEAWSTVPMHGDPVDSPGSTPGPEAAEDGLPPVEAVAAQVHASWMESKRAAGVSSRRLETGEELMRPYTELSEEAGARPGHCQNGLPSHPKRGRALMAVLLAGS